MDRAATAGAHGQDLIDQGHAAQVLRSCGRLLRRIHGWEFAHLGDPDEDLAWCEWIVRTHHPDHANALTDFFDAYGGRIPDWPRRQAAMVARCRELQKFRERWESAGRGAQQWMRRAHTTANWPA